MGEDENKFPVNVDVSATAKLSAELKAEVPTSSVGRTLDALVDIIRPFTERRGLQADNIRLQRQDVAIEIARRARAILEIEHIPISSVENKILLPLLEKGSLEELDSNTMIDKWAALLASAASEKAVHPRYVQILSELTGRDVELLEEIASNHMHAWRYPLDSFKQAHINASPGSVIYDNVLTMVDGVDLPEIEVLEIMEDIFNAPGRQMTSIALRSSRGDTIVKGDYNENRLRSQHALCASLGLLNRHVLNFHPKINGYSLPIRVSYHTLTETAINLIEVSSPLVMDKLSQHESSNMFKKSPLIDHYYYLGNILLVFRSSSSNIYAAAGHADPAMGLLF